MTHNNNLKTILPLLLVVFIDAAGVGVLFPIMSTIFMSNNQSILQYNSDSLKTLLYGITVGVFFLFWFFGATYISKFSDVAGRRKTLLICVTGLFVGYALTAVAILSLSMLIISRVIAGLTAGSQPVAQAAIIDLSSNKAKTKNLSLIMFSFSLGMIAGPIITSTCSALPIYKSFSLQMPFYLIMFLCVICYALIYRYYTNSTTAVTTGTIKFDYHDLYRQFSIIFTNKNLLITSSSFFFMQFAFNTFYVFISVFMFRAYSFSTFENGLNFFSMGIAMALSNLLLVPVISKRHCKENAIRKSLFLMVAVLIPFYLKNETLAIFSCSAFVIFFAIAYTNMLSLFSDCVTSDKQGWVMGISVSIFTLASFFTSIFTPMLFNISMMSPIDVTVIGCVIAYFILMKLQSDSHLVEK